MSEPSLKRIEELFHQAADLVPYEREAFLESACAGDSVLRAAVEELLRHDDGSGRTDSFVVSPIERTRVEEVPASSSGQWGEALGLLRHALEGFELLEVLGSGGMGVVFKARQLSLNRLVAVKMLLSSTPVTIEQLARFRTEAEVLARLQHPNIVQIYEIGEHEGRPYIVMEYVSGPDLARKIAGKPQPAKMAAELVAVLAAALQAVHRCGILHRDLKPANILLQEEQDTKNTKNTKTEQLEPESGRAERPLDASSFPWDSGPLWCSPKITDFGIAKRLNAGSGWTSSGAILGTPSYMAPEQACSGPKDLGPPTDIYAVGAILYELLTGRPPFEGASPAETIAQLLAEEPVSPARLRPTLPRDLVTICLKCLEKEPPKRYASAADLAEDLRRFLADEPIRARPVGLAERVWRWCQRRPLISALTAASALLTVALVVTILIYQSLLHTALTRRLEQTEQRADEEGRLNVEQRRELATLYRSMGTLALREGDAFTALLWMTETLRLDEKNHEHEQRDRMAISLILQQCPQLVRLQVPDPPVTSVELGGSGRWVAMLGKNQQIQVLDVLTGQARTLPDPLPAEKASLPLAISPDGRFLAVAAADGLLTIWDLEKGKPHLPRLRPVAPVQQAVFSDDDHKLITQLADRRVQEWNVQTGRLVALEGMENQPPRYAAVSDNGRWIFALSASGAGRLWRAEDGKALESTPGISPTATLAALSPDGRQLAGVDADSALWVWDIDTGKGRRAVPSLRMEGDIRELHWSPDGHRLLTLGSLDRARAWDVNTGAAITPALTQGDEVREAGFAANDRLFTLGAEGRVHVWAPLQPTEAESLTGIHASLLEAKTVPRSQVVHLINGTVVQADKPSTGAFLRPTDLHKPVARRVAFSPDGSCLVTALDDHAAQIWDAATGTRLAGPLRHRGTLFYGAFSSDGRHLATACTDGTAYLWETATGDPVAQFLKLPSDFDRLSFRVDGRRLAVIRNGDRVTTWDLTPDERPVEYLRAQAYVLCGRRIGPGGTLTPLPAGQLRSAWERLQTLRTEAPRARSVSRAPWLALRAH
jgi:serine/threonine protein kinase/WD40 repeat protein